MKQLAFTVSHHQREIRGVLYAPEKEKFPVAVFCHALNADFLRFSRTAEQFVSGGVGALLFPFAGGSVYDKSGFPSEKMTLFTEKEDLDAVLFALLREPYAEQIFLFGASQGAMVAALSAEERPETIAGMILLYPGFCIAEHWNARFPEEESIPDVLDLWGLKLGREYFLSLRGISTFERVGDFPNPVWIFQGAEDKLVPLSCAEEAAKRYQNARLTVYPGEGHGFSSEGNRKTAACALRFIQDLLKQG